MKLACYDWPEGEYIVRDEKTRFIVDEQGNEVIASVLVDNVDADWFRVRNKGE